MNDVEKARAGVMKELEAKRRHQKIYEDSRIKAEKKIGEKVIKGMVEEIDEHKDEVEEIGTYDPVTMKYIPSYRKEEEATPFQPGSGFEEPGCENIKNGDLKPTDQQPLNWNPRINGGLGGYEPAGYPTKEEEEGGGD